VGEKSSFNYVSNNRPGYLRVCSKDPVPFTYFEKRTTYGKSPSGMTCFILLYNLYSKHFALGVRFEITINMHVDVRVKLTLKLPALNAN